MVGIRPEFLYNFKPTIMKQQLQKMLCLDLFLSQKNKNNTTQQTQIECHNTLPLVSWDLFSDYYFQNLIASKKQMDLKKIKNFARKYRWKNDIDKLFKTIDFSAVILTDIHQNIMWVNEGFSSMTGYSKKEVLGRSPKFLQGPKTSKQKKLELNYRIKEDKPFSATILNYRKNNSTYNCAIHIVPLFAKKTTHFLALEREVL